jgi:hypothetical protein
VPPAESPPEPEEAAPVCVGEAVPVDDELVVVEDKSEVADVREVEVEVT